VGVKNCERGPVIAPHADWYAEINLSDLQKSLDTTALELVENQKENLVGRKKLAEQTRGRYFDRQRLHIRPGDTQSFL
jgi:hypothetical protein